MRRRLARGWRALQHLAVISREVKLLPPGELPQRVVPRFDATSDDQQTVSGLAYLHEVEICSRRLAYLDTLPAEVIKACKFLRHDLLRKVLYYDKISRVEVDGDTNKVIDDPIAGPWLFSQLVELGAEYFWTRWWGGFNTRYESSGPVCDGLETAWLGQETQIKTIEAHGMICIDRQVHRILARLRRHFIPIPGGALNQQHAIHECSRMEPLLVARERQKLTDKGEAAPEMVLAGISLGSKLDMGTFGRTMERRTRAEVEEARRQRRRQSGPGGPGELKLLPGFGTLFSDWSDDALRRSGHFRTGTGS
ncbi:hypothetical protein LTR08_008029 [Meristemomyces frigidus]|nr:hypothetical protein LTR08_008029 [Meristemomyces frigidus]